jgi:hypothetical protein
MTRVGFIEQGNPSQVEWEVSGKLGLLRQGSPADLFLSCIALSILRTRVSHGQS